MSTDEPSPAADARGPWRILQVVHDYLPEHIGGTELHAHQLGLWLRERGHDVRVLFTERDLDAEPGSVRRGELDGLPTMEMVHQREYAHARETFLPTDGPRVLRDAIAEFRPHVVHFQHLAFVGAKCLAVARSMGCAVVLTLHDYWLLCNGSTLLRPDGELCRPSRNVNCAECLAGLPLPGLAEGDPLREFELLELARARRQTHAKYLASAHRITAPSRFLLEQFEAAGLLRADDCVQQKTGYPGPVLPPRPLCTGTLRVGYVGGVYAEKGVHVAVAAMRDLVGRDIELVVHGVLDWFPDYVAGLRTAAEGAAVRFAGRFDPAAIDAVLATLDVLVVPSVWYENMPITIHEAFRNGLPVVATDLGGMAEAVADGVSGRLFPRGDAAALARVLGELEADRAQLERLGAGRPAVPGLDAVGARFEALYAELLGVRQGAPDAARGATDAARGATDAARGATDSARGAPGAGGEG